jgi:hypothetical protein
MAFVVSEALAAVLDSRIICEVELAIAPDIDTILVTELVVEATAIAVAAEAMFTNGKPLMTVVLPVPMAFICMLPWMKTSLPAFV